MDGSKDGIKGCVQWFMVIARVAGRDYLTKVAAGSCGGAEGVILGMDRSVRFGKAAVEACQAFDVKGVKTDCFAWMAVEAEPIGFEALKKIVEDRNEAIAKAARAVERIAEIEEAMEMLEAELRQCESVAGVL